MTRVVPLRPLCIVVAIDVRSPAPAPLERAFAIAAHVPRSLVYVATVVSGEYEAYRAEPALRRWATEQAARFPPFGARALEVHVLVGDVAGELARFAEARMADVVAVGERRRRFALRAALAERIARSLDCPVLVAHAPRVAPAPPILPPCAACVEARRKSSGTAAWCDSHVRPRAPFRRRFVPPSGIAQRVTSSWRAPS
jgi:nucleotide-binding universal stress UspA family protein